MQKKKERKRTNQGRDGRTARRHHTGILGEKCGALAVAHPRASNFLSLFAVSRLNFAACMWRMTPPSFRTAAGRR